MANKIKYGLSNCYYAVLNETAGTYGTPVAMPGAVNLSLDQEGETNNFRADNMDYYVSISNNGYSGTLELALIPDSFLTDVMGEIKDETSGLQYELGDAKPKAFAFLFQFEGDANAVRHVLYNCKTTRPTLASETTDTSITPGTDTLNLTAIAQEMTINSEKKPVVKAKCEPGDAAYSTFFTAVQTPAD
jgi:phi13 family phage major tail protein